MNQFRRSEGKKEKNSIFTKETLGVVFILFSAICLICLIAREKVFSAPGLYINSFLFGSFGYFSYPLFIWLGYYGVLLLLGKKTGLSLKQKVLLTLSIVFLALTLQISTGANSETYGEYLSKAYNQGAGGIVTSSASGVIVSLIAYPLTKLLTVVGSAVIMGLCFAVTVYFIVTDAIKIVKTQKENGVIKTTYVKEENEKSEVEINGVKDYPIEGVTFENPKPKQKLFISDPQDFSMKTKKEYGSEGTAKIQFTDKGLAVISYSDNQSNVPKENPSESYKRKIEYIKKTPLDSERAVNDSLYETSVKINSEKQGTSVSDFIPNTEKSVGRRNIFNDIPMFKHGENANEDNSKLPEKDEKLSEASESARRFADKYTNFEAVQQENDVKSNERNIGDILSRKTESEKEIAEKLSGSRITSEERMRDIFGSINVDSEEQQVENGYSLKDNEIPEETSGEEYKKEESDGLFTVNDSYEITEKEIPTEEPIEYVEEPIQAEEEPKKEEPRLLPKGYKYNRPPLDLLETRPTILAQSGENHEERMLIIKNTLESFKINVEPQSYVQGPTVTRYEIEMPAGISVKKVLSFDNDLRMRLESTAGVRIEAPIPGKNLVGIEVANKTRLKVGLKELMEDASKKPSKPGSLIFALGRDIVGEAQMDDLVKGLHFLVAGSTGSGKSVALNVMIMSLIMRYSPEEVRFVLVDPKSVGFRIYEHLPHLLIDEIITDAQRTISVLTWLYDEMERRYNLFTSCESVVSDIKSYNEYAETTNGEVEKLPRIVVVVDELADLMESCKRDMESRILALAQKARAAGIHLVLATQRPSVDIVTGTIKANLPSRIGLRLTNYNDSMTILSSGGAEKLLGNGDMLYKNSEMNEPSRLQGALITDVEIFNVVKYIKENNQAYFDQSLTEYLNKVNKSAKTDVSVADGEVEEEDDGDSELLKRALALSINLGVVSISFLQRKFKLGFARAARIVDKMEEEGYVSPNEGSKARRVLITKEEFFETFGQMPDSFD